MGIRRSICLWTTQKKKPVFTHALAHGIDESQVETEDVNIVRKPRWVTALGCLRYSDLFASGKRNYFPQSFLIFTIVSF